MAAPTDIVVVSDFASVNGGSAKVAIDSSIGLARNGLRVHFLAAVAPIAEALQRDGITVHCLGHKEAATVASRLHVGHNLLWNTAAERRLKKILAQCQSDRTIVHFHQWTKALSPSVLKAAHDCGFAFTITFHDYFTACPNGAFFVHPRQELCRRAPLSLSCSLCNCDARRYTHKLGRLLRQTAQTRVAGIPKRLEHGIYTSELSRRTLAPYLPSHMKWHFVMNPIDVPRTGRTDAARNRNFTFVGRLSPGKGAKLFADAAERAGVRPVLVGDGSERDGIACRHPEAEITGWLTQAMVIEYLKKARALVFPSLWLEPLGLSVWMARALGIPAIVSDQTAAAESVRDGETGLNFRCGDTADLAAKITQLSDDALVDRLSRKAYEDFWHDPPLIDKHVADLLKTYETILSSST